MQRSSSARNAGRLAPNVVDGTVAGFDGAGKGEEVRVIGSGCRSIVIAVAAAGMLLALALAGCSSNSNSKNNNAVATVAVAPAGAGGTAIPGAKTFSKAPSFTLDPNKGYIADIKTDHGDITVTLNAKAAPITVNNFVFLARQHYYDGLTCHRVIPGFVAQCGDPRGDGSGGPGYTIPDEPGPLTHQTGAIAMAKSSAPNSAGSQFYIVLAPQPSLDGKYTVFGQVTGDGMSIVNQIAPRDPATPTAPADRIISITIQETDSTPTPVASAAAPAGTAGSATPRAGSSPVATPAR